MNIHKNYVISTFIFFLLVVGVVTQTQGAEQIEKIQENDQKRTDDELLKKLEESIEIENKKLITEITLAFGKQKDEWSKLELAAKKQKEEFTKKSQQDKKAQEERIAAIEKRIEKRQKSPFSSVYRTLFAATPIEKSEPLGNQTEITTAKESLKREKKEEILQDQNTLKQKVTYERQQSSSLAEKTDSSSSPTFETKSVLSPRIKQIIAFVVLSGLLSTILYKKYYPNPTLLEKKKTKAKQNKKEIPKETPEKETPELEH